MDDTYIYSMREHLVEMQIDLQELNLIIVKRQLTRFEYRAAERSLQVLIEACIGIAKHWSYSLTRSAPADAYSAFERLAQVNAIDFDQIPWRKIIGLRNALVHDYLNIEPEIIRLVIKNAGYEPLLAFADSGLSCLQEHLNSN